MKATTFVAVIAVALSAVKMADNNHAFDYIKDTPVPKMEKSAQLVLGHRVGPDGNLMLVYKQ